MRVSKMTKNMKAAMLCMTLAAAAAGLTGCTEKTVSATAAAGERSTKAADKESKGANKESANASVSTSYDQYVTVGNYKGIQIDPIEVTDADIQAQIQQYLQQEAEEIQVTDRVAALGDVVNIDYVGYMDGEAFEGGSYQGQYLELGSGDFIPGFEDGLVGVMPGEEVTIPLTFPEDYWDSEMAGKPTEFDVKLNYIYELDESSAPEFTDELVQTWTGGELSTTKEYEDWLTNYMKMDALNYRRSQLMEQIMANCTFSSLPEDRLAAMTEEVTEYYTEMAQEQYGETLEEFATAEGMTLEQFQEELAYQAEESVKQVVVALAIAEAEGITVTDEECEASALSYGYEGFSAIVEAYGEDRAREIVLMDKVIDGLLEN